MVRLALDDVVARGGIGILFEDIGLLENAYDVLRTIQSDTPVVVVIEDLDNYCHNAHYESRILNFLDGVEEGVSNTIFLATTNYVDQLPDRIKNRPSRFDKKFEIGFPPAEHRARYLQSLLDSIPAGLDTFQDRIPFDRAIQDTDSLSLAHIKELFIAVTVLGSDYSATIEALKSGIEAEDLGSAGTGEDTPDPSGLTILSSCDY